MSNEFDDDDGLDAGNSSPSLASAAGPLLVVGLLTFAITPALAAWWESSAADRLEEYADVERPAVAVAAAADEGYCTPELKKVLRRVLQSCGLASASGGRGCQPMDASSIAALSGNDFNALFNPLADRAGILQFDKDDATLDEGDKAMLDRMFADQRGASWFLVAARSSPEGSVKHNRDLSQRRGEAVLSHLEAGFEDAELSKQVGLLWLGEEFAQLDAQYCDWQRSTDEPCDPDQLNRSAFLAWIDCRL
jgi:outer membrane protein OmpA-like peptidoglycan-associated protein